MSPEQYHQKDYTKEIDWWALGILMYELLFGISPFRIGKNKNGIAELEKKIKYNEPKFPDR